MAMPRTKSYLTPAEYAVLGLLRQRPAYGYELQRQLSGGHGLARVCPVEPAMVYAILKSLSGLELIDGEWDNSTYPPRAVYAATVEGDARFQRWLRQPVGRLREVRYDFMVKLYFALEEDPAQAVELVEQQIEACKEYEREIEEGAEEAEDASFDAIALQSKVTAARGTLQWLRACRRGLMARVGADGS
jgi:DNA-binding PadR family transcriptional regulator